MNFHFFEVRRRSGILPKRSGFTLIELLIVIAIIAVMCASSIAVITGPMFERLRAEDQEAFETGAGVFFATLTSDAHRAASLDVTGDTTATLTFTMHAPTTSTVRYTVDDAGMLIRSVDDRPPAKLIRSVRSLAVEKQTTGPLRQIAVTAMIHGYDGAATTITRRMNLAVGPAWTGGGFQ